MQGEEEERNKWGDLKRERLPDGDTSFSRSLPRRERYRGVSRKISILIHSQELSVKNLYVIYNETILYFSIIRNVRKKIIGYNW